MRVVAGLLLVVGCGWGQRLRDFTTPVPMPAGSTLVIGFLGGIERWDDSRRGVRKTVLRLRETPGVFAESVENRHRSAARELIFRAAPSRIVLFGQSLGGWAVVRLARELDQSRIPVALTVQVDSIGVGDTEIPPNVHAAANLFQRDFRPLRGAPVIHAADPLRTTILGNFQYHYKPGILVSPDESVFRTVILGAHKKMELDPAVWARVEQFIRDAIR